MYGLIALGCALAIFGHQSMRFLFSEVAFPLHRAKDLIRLHGVARLEAAWSALRFGGAQDNLLSEIERLRMDNDRLYELTVENATLSQALATQQSSPYALTYCRILSHGGGLGIWPTLRIDKGSRHGLKHGMVVIVADGLVGTLGSVGINQSEVSLISDPRTKISARIQLPNQSETVTGILMGNGGTLFDQTEFRFFYYEDPYTLKYLPRDRALQPRMVVETAGAGGLFPPGLTIGSIRKVQSSADKLAQEAIIEPAVNAMDLTFVFVIQGTAPHAKDL